MGKNQNRSPIQSFPTSTSERNAYAISTSIQHPSLSIRNPEELYRDGVDNPSYYNSEIELTISSYIHTSSLKHFDDHNIPAYATLKKCTFLKFWKLFFALFIVLVILMFGIAMTIYITDGTFYTSSDIEKDGFWAVKGEFRVINRVYNKVMNNHKSEAFVSLAAEVIKSVDELFIMSSLVRDYNSTEILGFRNGSVVVVCKILLNRPFSRAAELVGLTFAQSLKKGHGILPTKSLHVDITSIRFVGLPGVTTLSTDLNLITSPLRDVCPGYQYTCTNGQCISRDYFCDRYYDCEDHSDEPERCRVPCLINHKQCQNSRCVKRTAWCDGIDTCGDNSDESYCPLVSETKL
ncbi:enteropeptidase-like isoform X3 [Tachypleus tridentatus]|uniref:enteropeptidase-like isoform X3 n=1 Tax=Tachypleus tridentatus TaxID=6853 RepID=UPI003FD0CAFC